MAQFNVTGSGWSVVELPLPTRWRGRERFDDRRVLNGIVWRLRTGAPWHAILERCGRRTPR